MPHITPFKPGFLSLFSVSFKRIVFPLRNVINILCLLAKFSQPFQSLLPSESRFIHFWFNQDIEIFNLRHGVVSQSNLLQSIQAGENIWHIRLNLWFYSFQFLMNPLVNLFCCESVSASFFITGFQIRQSTDLCYHILLQNVTDVPMNVPNTIIWTLTTWRWGFAYIHCPVSCLVTVIWNTTIFVTCEVAG